MSQLEIISPSGEILFYSLNLAQGITNIGRHPSNDIILDGPDMVDFHAMLDHRVQPHQLLLLAVDENARLSASPLSPNVYCDLRNWDSIELGGFTLLYMNNHPADGNATGTMAAAEAIVGTSEAAPQEGIGHRHPVPEQIVPLRQEEAVAAGAALSPLNYREVPSEATIGQAGVPGSNGGRIGDLHLDDARFAESYSDATTIGASEAGQGASEDRAGRADARADGDSEAGAGQQMHATAEPARLGRPIPDERDEIIVVELSEAEQVVDVDQTATWQLTIVNGGPVVATFHARAEGWIHEEWVTVHPQVVNLNEGERATVQIAITPPKAPTSQAGLHYVAFVVTSPNFPDRRSLRGAALTINPYYEYQLGEISPKQQTISYFKPSGQLSIPIKNQSNDTATFRLDGMDDQVGTTFEFFLPGQEVGLVRQAEIALAPNEEVTIPVQITPNAKRMVAASSRTYSLTVSAALTESDQAPRAMLGQLKSKPLFGPLVLTILGLCIALAVVALMRPTIETFGFVPTMVDTVENGSQDAGDGAESNGGLPAVGDTKLPKFLGIKLPKLPKQLKPVTKVLNSLGLSTADEEGEAEEANNATASAKAGSEVALFWQASRSTSRLSIAKNVAGTLQPFQPAVTSPAGQVAFIADENATYILRAENWIVNLPIVGEIFGFDERKVVLVTDPLVPQIAAFTVDSASIVAGEPVILRWNIQDADTYTLEVNGVPQTLSEANGTLSFEPLVDTSFTLIADSPYATEAVRQPLNVAVSLPTPTPVPTPEITLFGASPGSIVAGESVRLDWNVMGADSVVIDPLGAAASTEGFREEVLTEAKTWVFTLKAEKGGSTNNRSVQVQVLAPTATPTATPAPQPAVVQVFDVIPNEVVAGSDAVNDVKATWTVIGDYTNIQISSPEFGPVANLAREGTMKLPGNRTTVYQITVFWEGEVVTSLAKELTVIEPTPTPVPTDTPAPTDTPVPPTPLPTETPLPTPTLPPNIIYFRASGDPDKISFNDSTSKYVVVAGTEVTLSWQVENATEVTLLNEGPQPLEVQDFVRNITVDVDYTLQANNGIGAPQSAFVRFTATSPPAPPIVFAVTGSYNEDGTPALLKWSYDGEAQDDIIGFRVYRASTSDFNFERVADWTQLDALQRQWEDSEMLSCSHAFYVVAVYEDVTQPEDSRIKETGISNETWLADPCP